MPTMFEIYDHHPREYDELVSREDHEGNLPRTLRRFFDFRGKTVIELGTGTGRVTAMYAGEAARVHCYDRAAPMLERAKSNLKDHRDKIRFGVIENTQIGSIGQRADCVIEGWAFGHTIGEHRERIEEVTAKLVADCLQLCSPGGVVILIETLGTNAGPPAPPSESLAEFYRLLETQHGFHREVVATDYKFESTEEAKRIVGFFFGPQSNAAQNISGPIVPEYTGVWWRRAEGE